MEDKRLIDLTTKELGILIEGIIEKVKIKTHQEQEEKKQYVYGISGIAKLFNCSRTTAYRIKSSGAIDGAISQRGRLIITDTAKAIELMREAKI